MNLKLTFTTPLLPDDIDTLSRPITYLTYEAVATDGAEHDLQIFFAASAELAVNVPEQHVTYATPSKSPALRCSAIGSQQQAVLATKGDDRRIDWGYLYVAAPSRGCLAGPEYEQDAVRGFRRRCCTASPPR